MIQIKISGRANVKILAPLSFKAPLQGEKWSLEQEYAKNCIYKALQGD